MTPEERQMISGLFDRMRQQGAVEKDREAEALIRESVSRHPDAPYIMVQTVLVQEMALQNAQQQIEDLQQRVRALEAQAARPQQSSGSFLGGLFGGSRPQSAPPTVAPSAGRPALGSAPMGRPGSPWGNAPGAQQMGAGMAQQQPAAGGGFMRTAMATAAGVAGGMLAANAISSMLNGGSSAQAAPASSANDPAGAYEASSADDGNDPAGFYDSADEGSYDDGGSWSDE